jgi:6-pyruvoyltetrahydropterin/6-carboxytetrahydropterin synthase
MLLRKDFSFDAAHRLEQYHGKCERLHGHTYRMRVELSGVPDEEGMIADFLMVNEIENAEIISKFDHSNLNDTIPQPSAENIARYAFERLSPKLSGPNYSLSSVEVWETPTSSAVFSREDAGTR